MPAPESPVASPLIVALDFPEAAAALALADRLDPALCRVKVGKELFTRAGPAVVEALVGRGFQVFLDLKYHDIPNTVAGACRAAAELGVWMVNVHALGGRRMMGAAREALEAAGAPRPHLIAVTVLTSMAREDLEEVGLAGEPRDHVLRLARLTRDSGLDGVVCSPREAALVRDAVGADFLRVTPGIRPAGAERGDQRRTLGPAEALAAGADYLVVGRPVTAAPDPLAALHALLADLETGPREG